MRSGSTRVRGIRIVAIATAPRTLSLERLDRPHAPADRVDHPLAAAVRAGAPLFLTRPRALFGLGPGDAEIARQLNLLEQGQAEMPPGCEVTYELEAREILFVKAMGDLPPGRARALEVAGEFLDELQTTQMTRSYKMLTLLAMLDADAFPGEIEAGALAGGRPNLFLPPWEQHPGIPSGWTDIVADGKPYRANFVKVAVNVVQEPGSEENRLPELLRAWFGPDAGTPGTAHQVAFTRAEDRWALAPARREADASGPVLWRSYMREEIPGILGLRFRGNLWR